MNINGYNCMQVNGSNVWGKMKYKNCSNPTPKYGGSPCSPDNSFTQYHVAVCAAGNDPNDEIADRSFQWTRSD